MHTGGYLTIKSSRYAQWRLLNHYVRVQGLTISQVRTLEVAQPLCQSSPSLGYAHWRLLNHYVGVHHLSVMHTGGCSTTVSGFTISRVCTVEGSPSLMYAHWKLLNHYVGVHGSPSLRYAHWRLLNHCVGVHHLLGTHTGGWSTTMLGFMVHHLSGMHIGGCSATMLGCRGSPSLRYTYWRLTDRYMLLFNTLQSTVT